MKYQTTTTKRVISGTSLLAFSALVAGCGVDETMVQNAYLAGYLEGTGQVPLALFMDLDLEEWGEVGPQDYEIEDLWEEVSCADRHEMLVANCDHSGLDLLNTSRVAAYDQGLDDGCGLGSDADEAGIEFACNLKVDRDGQGERGAGYNWLTTADSPETCDQVSLYLLKEYDGCVRTTGIGQLVKDW